MKLPVLLVALAAILAACGSSGSDLGQPSGSESPPSGSSSVACAEIWVAGETLPPGYEGCGGSGFTEIPGKCDDGAPYFGVHTKKTEMFALPGKTIVDEDGGDTDSYDKFYAECFGD